MTAAALAETYKGHPVENGIVALGDALPEVHWGKTRFVNNISFLDAASGVGPNTPLAGFLAEQGYTDSTLTLAVKPTRDFRVNGKMLAQHVKQAGIPEAAATTQGRQLVQAGHNAVPEFSLDLSKVTVGQMKALLTATDYIELPAITLNIAAPRQQAAAQPAAVEPHHGRSSHINGPDTVTHTSDVVGVGATHMGIL